MHRPGEPTPAGDPYKDRGVVAEPRGLGGEHARQQRQPAVGQRLAVQVDEPLDPHVATRTAAARSRSRRSAEASPPPASLSASTTALPTTTPSATRAAAAAWAGVLIPNPTATGREVTARMRRTWTARSGGASGRAPVTPRRAMK